MRPFILGTFLLLLCFSGCGKRSSIAYRPPLQQQPRPTPQPSTAVPPIAGRPPVSRAGGDPAWFPRSGKISPRWTTIVVHHSATASGNARIFDRAHRDKGWDELGYHFVIGNGTTSGDGVVEVGTRWHAQKHGAHCKTPDNYYNDHGIGICLVGDFTKTRPTPRQMASLQRLAAFLSEQCGIPGNRITTHSLVTHKTLCPGRNFPIAWVRRSLVSMGATASAMP